MSEEIDLPIPDPGSLKRGRFTYFPVVPGRLEFAIEVRAAILRDRPEVIALELPATLQPAWMRAVSRLPEMSLIFYPDEDGGEDQAVYVPVEPADPFTEAIRTGLEIGAEIVFADPDAGHRPHLKDAYPDPYAMRHIGLERYIEAYRVYPQPRSEEIARHAAGIAWKLQGADPLANVLVVISLNLLDPVLDAMEEPQAQPLARSRREGVELLNPHPESLAEILLEYPALQWRYENFRGLMTDANLIDRRHAQLAVFREAEKEYEANTGERIAHWQRRLLARYTRNLALAANDLSAGIFDLTVAARGIADDNYAWDVWEAAGRYPPQRMESDLATVRISGEEVWIDTRRIRLRRRLPSTKQKLRPYGLKPRKKEKFPGRMGQPVERRRHLLVSARRPGHRGLRPLSQEEGQEHPLRGARARGALHHVDSGRHRHARDHPQVVRKAHLRAPVPEDPRRGGQRGGDLRRGSRQPLLLHDHLARREPERIRHGILFHLPVRQPGGPGHRTRRIRRLSDEPAAAPHVRRLAGPGLRIRRIQIRAAAAGGARLFDPPPRGLRGRQTAAHDFPRPSPRAWGAPSCTFRSASSRRSR